MSETPPPTTPHRRRQRYSGKHPRRFEQKYKEHAPALYPEVVQKVIAAGKTPAGGHRPILVEEILRILNPQPGDTAVDCTLGFGGHSLELLRRLQPGGRLLGLDADPLELPRTEARLRHEGFGPDTFSAHRCNFAGIASVLASQTPPLAHLILADLGVSSMQLDNPLRGFSLKFDGPLDMRMNPGKGQSARELLRKIEPQQLAIMLSENSDEPHDKLLASALSGGDFATTLQLAKAIRAKLSTKPEKERETSVRRVFQALRIAVNGEFEALDTLLKHLPHCLAPGGRVAVLSFHSGEDRRVKKAFERALQDGLFSAISPEIIRADEEERRSNPRSKSAKLRWAIKTG